MTTITATLSSELVRLGSYKPVPFHGIGSLTAGKPLILSLKVIRLTDRDIHTKSQAYRVSINCNTRYHGTH